MRFGLSVSAAALGGLLGAGATHADDPLVLAFCFAFWGGAAAAVAWLVSRIRLSRAVDDSADVAAPLPEDRGGDDVGYQAFGITDVENTPRPGAHGFGEETVRWLRR